MLVYLTILGMLIFAAVGGAIAGRGRRPIVGTAVAVVSFAAGLAGLVLAS